MNLLEAYTPFSYGAAFVFGLLWGSFFNVCIVRLPEEQDVIFKPSHCPRCKGKIPPYLNIPVLSWILLKGRCKNCLTWISIQYPLVELAAGGLFVWTHFTYGWSVWFFTHTLFLSALFVASVIDFHHKIIPDEISLGGLMVGLLVSFIPGGLLWWESLAGAFLGGGLFFAISYGYEKIAKREGLGGGDVKLLAMMGAWLGYQSIFPIILISSAVGSVAGIGVMVSQRNRDLKLAIPFGPFLALGAYLYNFWAPEIMTFLFPTLT